MVGTTPMSPQQDPLALGTNKTPLDPLAFRYIPALTDTPNTKDTRQSIQKPKTTSKQGPKTSTRLTLVQRILDDAIQKVDTALFIKDNHVAFGVNEKLGLTSETAEKITIQTQNNAKVMELLVVKNNPIINKQVDEAFKDIDQAIDKALNKLNAHDLKSSSYPSYCRGTQTTTDAIEEENQRLKSEIRSLKWELQKKKAVLTTPTKTTKKLVYWVKEPGSSAIKTPTKTVCKKTVTLSSKKPGMSPRKTPVPAVVKKFTLPLITSVTSLSTAEMDDVEKTADAVDACVEDKLSNDHTNTTTDSTNKANDIVDLTD
ncbi:unnamed protein product [Acanthoscelides obtectus]|nr:unnamed protein product [Acanthoscelides obtectus]CAK1664574.1 hypothetical protein AOBTE_LOCUS24343 [Acanthoscelides obtectus]